MKSKRFYEPSNDYEFVGIFKHGSPHKYNDSMIYYREQDDINIKKARYKGISSRQVKLFAQDEHKGTDPVKPYGYKRDIMFGSKGSTGHLKDF